MLLHLAVSVIVFGRPVASTSLLKLNWYNIPASDNYISSLELYIYTGIWTKLLELKMMEQLPIACGLRGNTVQNSEKTLKYSSTLISQPFPNETATFCIQINAFIIILHVE